MKRDEKKPSSQAPDNKRAAVRTESEWKRHRSYDPSSSKRFVHRSRGMSKLTDNERVELLRAKLDIGKTSDKHVKGVTQQINREDPQAGYDQQQPDTLSNGKVSRNPKDGREGNA